MPHKPAAQPAAIAHSWAEDLFGLANGCLLLALGLHLLHKAGLMTGGMAGLALLLSYLLPLPPGGLFAALNLPIFLLFWRSLGTPYILRSLAATLCVTVLVDLVAQELEVAHIGMGLASVMGGTVLGIGILAVTRHGTGVGGLAVIARWICGRTGWRFGAVCMAADAVIVASGFASLGAERGFYSLMTALMMNVVVLVWHRPDRYLAPA